VSFGGSSYSPAAAGHHRQRLRAARRR
jgi:hypothetical protein